MLREVLNETSIEVCKADERLNVSNELRGFSGHNSLHLEGIHLDSVDGNDQSKILNFDSVKLTFLNIELKACLLKSLKNLTNVMNMFLLVPTID